MSRYFISNSQISENRVTILGEDYQHLKKVLRVQKDDLITVCCDQVDYITKVDEINSNSIISVIVDRKANLTESSLRVTLYQSLPKADKMELIVQKCVEIGVYEIVPVITDRCISKISTDKDAQNKIARWQKIAMEAAKQSNRGIVPQISKPIKFSDALKLVSKTDLAIIPYEKESAANFKDISKQCSGIKASCVFIGPEGGFTEQEIQLAESSGVKKITLGPRILRTETAGFVTLTIMMYELGDVSNGGIEVCCS